MTKYFYLITKKLQTPLRCKVLGEKKCLVGGKRMKEYLIELDQPLPRKTYSGISKDQSASQWRFYPHGSQPWPKTGPFWGTIGGTDRAFLCASEKQAQEYLRFLEKAKQGMYFLKVSGNWLPARECQIIQDIAFDDGEKGWWLAKVNPPFPGKAFRRPKDFSQVLLALDDFPVPGLPVIVGICFIYQNIAIGDTVHLKEIGLKQVATGTLWRPQDLEREQLQSNKKKGGGASHDH